MHSLSSSRRAYCLSRSVATSCGARRRRRRDAPVADATKYDLRYKLATGTVLRYADRPSRRDPQHDRRDDAGSPDQDRIGQGLEGDRRAAQRRDRIHERRRAGPHGQSPARSRPGRIRQPAKTKRRRPATKTRPARSACRSRVVRMTPRGKIASRNVKLQPAQRRQRRPDRDPPAGRAGRRRRHLGRAVRRDRQHRRRRHQERSKPAATTSCCRSPTASPRSKSPTRSSRRSTPRSNRNSCRS